MIATKSPRTPSTSPSISILGSTAPSSPFPASQRSRVSFPELVSPPGPRSHLNSPPILLNSVTDHQSATRTSVWAKGTPPLATPDKRAQPGVGQSRCAAAWLTCHVSSSLPAGPWDPPRGRESDGSGWFDNPPGDAPARAAMPCAHVPRRGPHEREGVCGHSRAAARRCGTRPGTYDGTPFPNSMPPPSRTQRLLNRFGRGRI